MTNTKHKAPARASVSTLDPGLHCRHATHDKPLVRACWNRDRGDPCQFCARVEQENREFADARERLLATETYYENIRRTEHSLDRAGTYALWAAELYEQAGKSVERALSLISGSGADDDQAPLIRCHIRMMSELQRGSIARWFELLREEGLMANEPVFICGLAKTYPE